MNRKHILLFSLPVLLAAAPALAQDEGLYPDPSSPDASFVRVSAPHAERAIVDGNSVSTGDADMTHYVEVKPGHVTISAGEIETEVEIGANTHYTVLAGEKGAPLITDQVTDSPAQADLLLYNLSDMETFDLYAVEAETVALADVAPGGHTAVGLQAPLTLTFELRQDDETLDTLEPVDLRRGTATTIVVSDGGEIASMTSTYAD